MAQVTIYQVESRVLSALSASEGVALLRDLLWCEASRVSVPRQKIVMSLNNTVKDGGVDAKVEDAPATESLLIRGSSFFQLKTGKSFKPWEPSAIRKELFGKSSAKPSKRLLGPALKKCLDNGGRYVLVTMGHDLQPIEHTNAVDTLRQYLKAAGYKKPNVDVYGQGQIIGLLSQFPSLSLGLNQRAEFSFQSAESWSRNADMAAELKLGAQQSELIEEIRSAVRGTSHQHIRIIGEPGIGKSRLVLEAVRSGDIAPSVIYVPNGEEFQQSQLFNELLRPDRQLFATLVIDDCDDRGRASIWNALRHRTNVKIVSIDHGPEESSDSLMLVLPCPPLPDDRIAEIISSYTKTKADLSNWASFCGGSPRVAHAVGENLKQNPNDLLKSPANVPIWERFILGHKRRSGVEAERLTTALRHIAVFSRFGFEQPVQNEARFISEWVREADPTITWAAFQQIVTHYKKRRILQGRHTLFIVPRALQVYLWKGFWDEFGRGFDFDSFFSRMPASLRRWFLQLFVYAHTSPVATDVVRNILSPLTGPFSDKHFLLSDAGARFVSHLAEAEPSATLYLIENTYGTWPLEDLRGWHTGRQDIVWALEKIAAWEDTCSRVIRVLCRMSIAENAKNSNNSTGLFCGLFHVMAPTQAPASIRLPLIEELLDNSDPHYRTLGLTACGQWLDTRGYTRIVGAEYQGLRPRINFWVPKTYGELWGYWKSAWELLFKKTRGWPTNERSLANKQLIESAAGLLRVKTLAPIVLKALFDLAKDTATDTSQLTSFVISTLRFREDSLEKYVVNRLKILDRQITGTSLLSRITRYVLNTTWDEDYRVHKDKVIDEVLPIKKRRQLVKELSSKPSDLYQLLPKLAGAEGHKLYEFAKEIASSAHSSALLSRLVVCQRKLLPEMKTQFIGGYFSGVREIDRKVWEKEVLALLNSKVLREVGIDVILRSGYSEKITKKLISLFEQRHISPRGFSRLGWSAAENEVSSGTAEGAIRALLSKGTRETSESAIELLHHYYLNKERPRALPELLTYRALTSRGLFTSKTTNTMVGYYWYEVAKIFRSQCPKFDIKLFNHILRNVKDLYGGKVGDYPSKMADAIARDNPQETWKIVEKLLAAKSPRSYSVRYWLTDSGFDDKPNRGSITNFPPDVVMSWVRKAPKQRAPIIASCLPKTLNAAEGGLLTKMFIETYSNETRMSGHLISHFWTGSWTGPESSYLSKKRDEARTWLSDAAESNLRSWLLNYIDYLNKRVAESEIREEREF